MSFEGKKVVVIGGLGFIGSNSAIRFAELGANVTVIDACLDPYGWNFANLKGFEQKISFVKGDVRDLNLMKQELKGADVVFNCAAQVGHLESLHQPLLDIDINALGSLNVLEACRQVCDSAKVLYASTRGVIGIMKYSPIDENHPTEPLDLNGIHKLAAEKYYSVYYSIYGMPTTSMRINNTYGERHQMKHSRYGILNWFIRLSMEGKPITIYGDGMQTRDYNYVSDVIDAVVLSAESEKANGQVFNLGSGIETKVIDMANLVVACVGKGEVKLVPWPSDRKSIEIGNFLMSYSKIENALGWKPRVSLKDGIVKTVEFYRTRLPDYI